MNKNIEDNDFLKYVLFTDDVTFTHGSAFNTHNLHMLQNENPHVVGIIGNNLVEPYLLPTRLTRDMYELFLRQILPEHLDEVPLYIRRQMWFQHDGASAHTSRNV